jgi:protein-L-isoaspartate O-methyltransferase
MASASHTALPSDARRLFSSADTLRRIARIAHWVPGARVLELAASPVAGLLVSELKATVTAVDSDARILDGVRERLKVAGLQDKVSFKQGSLGALPFGDAEFDGIIALGQLLAPPDEAAIALRRHLAPKGRVALTWPVKFGRNATGAALDFWQARLGQPLLLPRDALMSVERHGFEPETIETVGENELDEYYGELEALLARQPPAPEQAKSIKEEIAAHRSLGGRSGVTLALIVARRKEPGERPPASRDGG